MEKNDKTFLCGAGGKKDFGVKIGERLTIDSLTDCFLSANFPNAKLAEDGVEQIFCRRLALAVQLHSRLFWRGGQNKH
jgi:hypothetical protein